MATEQRYFDGLYTKDGLAEIFSQFLPDVFENSTAEMPLLCKVGNYRTYHRRVTARGALRHIGKRAQSGQSIDCQWGGSREGSATVSTSPRKTVPMQKNILTIRKESGKETFFVRIRGLDEDVLGEIGNVTFPMRKAEYGVSRTVVTEGQEGGWSNYVDVWVKPKLEPGSKRQPDAEPKPPNLYTLKDVFKVACERA